jgi:hypothetical protein
MTLCDYYCLDPRLTLIPIEQLTPGGMRPDLAALLQARCGWDEDRSALFNTAFALYWTRTAWLAARSQHWAPPRLRHVGLIHGPLAVRPYVQLLNSSAWTLYASDFDAASSHAEFAAYLLVHGDRMAQSGEVTSAALHSAAYWFERSDDECAAFAAAAARSQRPDAVGFAAVAAALPWLRQLYHDELRPPPATTVTRAIPGTGLRVPRHVEERPAALVHEWTTIARQAVTTFHAASRTPAAGATAALCDWLTADARPLLVTGRGGRVLWDADAPARLGAVRTELRNASGAAIHDVISDLKVIAAHTRAFLAALVAPHALPPPAPDTEQSGYSYLHRERRLIAYNLHEPGMERLQSPALPYARAMLGARTVHEWTHLAVDAGWVPQRVSAAQATDLRAALAGELDEAIAAAPAAIRARTAADLRALGADDTPGAALARVLLKRMPDYQANLLACRFLDLNERETYIRHNIRTLRGLYTPAQLWRMLVRYLAEYQYLTFSAVADPVEYFVRSTWFEADFFASGVLHPARFAALTAAVRRICETYNIDEACFRAVGN